jgi:hypothetical protein
VSSLFKHSKHIARRKDRGYKKAIFKFLLFSPFFFNFHIAVSSATRHRQMQLISTLFLILFEKVAKICSMLNDFG